MWKTKDNLWQTWSAKLMTFVTYSQVLSFDTTRTSSLLCFHRSMNWKCPKQQNEEYILTRSEALGPLDYEISEQETVKSIDLLKTGKAPGVDNILCELLKHGKEALKGPLTILFNNILISGRYPTLWRRGLNLYQSSKKMIRPTQRIIEELLSYQPWERFLPQ